MRKPIIAGNWKMYKQIKEAVSLVEGLCKNLSKIGEREVVICPPFTSLSAVKETLKDSIIKLGAQNMFWEEKGAYTGEISPVMLKDVGCEYVIIGHSERRQYFGETDENVNKKTKKALQIELIPIVCIGENLEEREKNITFNVVEKQLREGLKELSEKEVNKLVIAYEPVWAIGTGKTATPQQAEEVQHYIRKTLTQTYGEDSATLIRILYGGSVKPENIKDLMIQPNIDGALVGGASLEIESFVKIVNF